MLLTVFLPDLILTWFLSYNKKFWKSIISVWVRVPKNWPEDELFKLRKLKCRTTYRVTKTSLQCTIDNCINLQSYKIINAQNSLCSNNFCSHARGWHKFLISLYMPLLLWVLQGRLIWGLNLLNSVTY